MGNPVTEIKRAQRPTKFKTNKGHYIDILSGVRDKENVFIVDENNNKDFTDDSIRVYENIKWYSSNGLIKCKYQIWDDQKTVQDSSWVKIGTVRNNLFYGRSEHLTSSFQIDERSYQVGVIDLRSGDFTYGIDSEIALFTDNRSKKDTLLKRDILKLGELLNLGGNYYRFENISNLGKYITLIKEKSPNDRMGTQVGMIAPNFKCISVAGDTITSSNLNDRIMVIANSCGCGGDQLSTKAYYDMLAEFGDKAHIFHLDSKLDKGLTGLQIDMENKFNSDIYYKYRSTYCSRICYVVDKNKRVIDKFSISDWKSFLPEHLKN